MRDWFTASRVRWLVLAGFVIVSGIPLWSFLLRKWEAPPQRPLPPKIAGDVDQRTQIFSLSKTLGDQTLYRVQARQVTNFKGTGKAVLRDVSILLYGKQGQRQDRIFTTECEYDSKTGLLWMPGKVGIQLQAPPTNGGNRKADGDSPSISIFTSGLSFDQNTGIASTDQEVRFYFAEGQGLSQGATYNPQEAWLILKQNVRFALHEAQPNPQAPAPRTSPAPPGEIEEPAGTSFPEGTHTYVQAASLRFHRAQNRILLAAPVEITQASRRLQAGDSEIVLDDQHRARQAVLSGNIVGTFRNSAEVSEIQARKGLLEFTPSGKVKSLRLEEAVRWVSTSPRSLKRGQAQRAELYFSQPSGLLDRILAYESVKVALSRPAPPGSPAELSEGPPGKVFAAGSQLLSAQQAEIVLGEDGQTLRQVRTRSSSTLELTAAQPGQNDWTVQADNFQIEFTPEGEVVRFAAQDHVRLTGEVPEQPSRRKLSTSHSLLASLDPLTHSLQQLQQWGNFYYEDSEKHAKAERADYSVDRGVLRLQGNPTVWNASGKIAAREIVWKDASRELTAEGNVSTTYLPEPSPGGTPPEPIHIVADQFRYASATELAQYQGKVRFWQGTNLLEAGWLELDQQQRQFVARNGVYSVFQGFALRPDLRPGEPPETTEIRSESLVYDQKLRTAHYQDNVRMRNASRILTAKELKAFLTASASGRFTTNEGIGKQLERAVASGDVRIVEGRRTASGRQAEYLPGQGRILLFGSPAVITDEPGRSMQGARLTYLMGDDSIALEGEPGLSTQTQWQVQR